MNVLGVSCFYHDAAATLVQDGEVVAAVEEERFTRQKHDNSFPENAIEYCLEEGGIEAEELDRVVFYEKPIQKFDRILETAADVFPRGYLFFSEVLPEWLGTKLRIRKKLAKEIGYEGEVEFLEHHHSHAASAFYPSPFDEAAVLTVDGIGEWKSNELFVAGEEGIEPLKHIEFPDSIGLLYSTITA
ncbi:MAG: carbamoyltransferase N-terminal domain-containing protein, partial [Candidatus Nanohaloarchaea archaeon]